MQELCRRFGRLYAGLIYDVLEHLGYPGQVLCHEIGPLAPQMKLAGPAFTVKGTTACDRDETVRQRRPEMIRHMPSPCVEVFARHKRL